MTLMNGAHQILYVETMRAFAPAACSQAVRILTKLLCVLSTPVAVIEEGDVGYAFGCHHGKIAWCLLTCLYGAINTTTTSLHPSTNFKRNVHSPLLHAFYH